MCQRSSRMRQAALLLSFSFCAMVIGCSAAPQPQPRVMNFLPNSTAAAPDATPLPAKPSAAAEIDPSYVSTPTDLRVMTFNLRVPFILDAWNFWPARRDLTLETIERFDPDILGTQELVKSAAEYLRENLTAYDFVGVGRNDGKTRGEMVGMFFKRERFEKLAEGNFWLSDKPDKAGSKSWGNGAPRMVSWLKLQPRDGSPAFCWFNTHFDTGSSHAREES